MCLKETRTWASRSCSEGWPMCTDNSFSSPGLMRALARIQLRWQRHWQPIRRSDLSFIGLFRGQLLVALISQFSVFNFIDFSSYLYYCLSFAALCFSCLVFQGFQMDLRWIRKFPSSDACIWHFTFSPWCCFSCIPWILISCVFIHIQSYVQSLFSLELTLWCTDYWSIWGFPHYLSVVDFQLESTTERNTFFMIFGS